ncbi:MAG: hypothetical protein QNK37_32450 [Acidobacteriota bacterium]|nr:hypothetical protein [Acidobacteriota bacterium]
MVGNQGKLFKVLEWLEDEGEVKAVARLRMKILPFTVQESIVISRIDRKTTCSGALLAAARNAASEIAGKRCPV